LFLEYEAVLKRPEQLAAGQRSVATVDAFLDALVTFNVGDFDAADKFALPVLSPAAFLQLLNRGEN